MPSTAAGHRVVLRDPDAGLLPFLARRAPRRRVPRPARLERRGRLAARPARGARRAVRRLDGIAARGAPGTSPSRARSSPRAASRFPDRSCSRTRRSASSAPSSVLRVVRQAPRGRPRREARLRADRRRASPSSTTRTTCPARWSTRSPTTTWRWSSSASSAPRSRSAVVDTGDGPRALPAVEIEPPAGVYGFQARYNAGETTFYAPSRLPTRWSRSASDAAMHRAPRARPARPLARRLHRRRRRDVPGSSKRTCCPASPRPRSCRWRSRRRARRCCDVQRARHRRAPRGAN